MKHNAQNVEVCRRYSHTGFDCHAFRIHYERKGNDPEMFESALIGAIEHWSAQELGDEGPFIDEDAADLALRGAELDWGAAW